jgi:hypothetical protein
MQDLAADLWFEFGGFTEEGGAAHAVTDALGIAHPGRAAEPMRGFAPATDGFEGAPFVQGAEGEEQGDGEQRPGVTE